MRLIHRMRAVRPSPYKGSFAQVGRQFMKVLAVLLFSLYLPALHSKPTAPAPVDHSLVKKVRHRGTWYFAENGHAVYCYGPVLMVPVKEIGLQRVATFCRDGQTMVPLKD
jgi:hypothetical protein